MESLIFDTTFLIDFQAERKRKRQGPAHVFLSRHRDKGAYLPAIVYGEYAEGFEDPEDAAFVSIVESFEIVPVSREVAGHYGRITRFLRREGRLISGNDLWIAATALACGFPLVTNNTDHFTRVPGLKLLAH